MLIAFAVLYSAQKGWWKIADFGITSDGATWQLKTTSAARGTHGYRAPELLREHLGYSKRADIWSLGCILHELCTGKPAFLNDFAIFDFRSPVDLSIPFLEGLSADFKNAVRSLWLNPMLQRDHQKRPSAKELIDHLAAVMTTFVPSIAGKVFVFVAEVDMIGTDGPLLLATPRWDDLFLPGGFEQHTAMFQRYRRISATRNLLLGPEHPASLWSTSRLAWSHMHRSHFLFEDYGGSYGLFKDLLERHELAFGPLDLKTFAIKQGLALTSRLQRESISLLQEVLEWRTRLLGADHLETLWTRGELAWIMRDQDNAGEVRRELEYVLRRRKTLYGPEHRDTLRNMARMSWFFNWTEEYDMAFDWFQVTAAVEKRLLGKGHARTAESMMGLAFCHHHLHHSAEVTIPAMEEALQAVRMVFGPEHAYTRAISELMQEWGPRVS